VPTTHGSCGAELPSDRSSDRCRCGSTSAPNSICAASDGSAAALSGGLYGQDCHPQVHQSGVQHTQLSPAFTSEIDFRLGPVYGS
jgi:hypothetical protein